MRNTFWRILALMLMVLFIWPLAVTAQAAEESKQATILFTHDLHSHLLPSVDEDGGEYGGYARLMTAIQEQKEKHPDAILVDGGDFAMGSPAQTAHPTPAIELRLMGAMGYDATTFGNHEFDYLPQGMMDMLYSAKNSEDPLPALVDANYLPPVEGDPAYSEEAAAMWDALNAYGVKPYILIERGGIPYAIFGLVGLDSNGCAPNSGMIWQEPAIVAQQVVEEAKAESKERYDAEPLVIALSHSGTEDGQGEDYELAQKVSGIHLIVSGHTHTMLEKPIQVNDTYIVSAAEYGKNLGVVQMEYFEDGTAKLTDYTLIPIDETMDEDEEIASLVEQFKVSVEEDYLSDYNMTFDQILVNNPYVFDNVDQVYDYAHESTLGNVFSDAYRWAVKEFTGEAVDVTLTASGVIRESIPIGDVTVSDIFNAASLGVGTEGELVAIYLTGSDLKNALEVDASVYPLMHSAQLFYSGVEYSYNTNRMIFNKIDYAMLRRNDGTLEAIEDNKMYRVACGMYMGQMLGSVESTSYGMLVITPRDQDGNPIAKKDLVNYVVRDDKGTPIKEWYAIAAYLDEMEETMDPQYGQADGRKVIYSSWNPASLLRNANKFTYILLTVSLLLILLLMWLVHKVIFAVNRKNKNRRNGT